MAQQHYIRRNNLVIKAETSDGLLFQERIRHLLEKKVLPGLSDSFDGIASEHDYIIIDRLDIELDAINESELDEKFAEEVIRKITSQVKDKRDRIITSGSKNVVDTKLVSRHEKVRAAFLFFLSDGVLPWWFDVTDHAEFETQLEQSFQSLVSEQKSPEFNAELRRTLGDHRARHRLIRQFRKSIYYYSFESLIEAHDDVGGISIKSLLEWLEKFISEYPSTQDRKSTLEKIKYKFIEELVVTQMNLDLRIAFINALHYLPDQMRDQALLDLQGVDLRYAEIVADLLQEKDLGDDIEKGIRSQEEKSKSKKQPEEKHDGIIVHNAGLVIVAPLLPYLFEDLGLLEGSDLRDKSKAIAILHFIVYGNLEYREYHTSLNKILCGLESHEHIELIDLLTDAEVSKIEDLLLSVIGHWKVLKNVSPDGLREGFLQRTGRLTLRDENVYLKVEQNSIDLLLNDLPWSFSMIKLFWMKSILKTEWI